MARAKGLPVSERLHGAEEVRAFIDRLAGEVERSMRQPDRTAFIGVRSGGIYLAERVRARVAERKGWNVPIGSLDITLYRDDLRHSVAPPRVKGSDIDFALEGRIVYLFDDVLYTGRTIRAALTALEDYGRSQAVRLVVLVDRGHRELPVQPDFVGVKIATGYEDLILATLDGANGEDAILIQRGRITATQ